MRLGIRQKLVLLSLLFLVVISFGFTALHLTISSGWLEEDLRERDGRRFLRDGIQAGLLIDCITLSSDRLPGQAKSNEL